MAGFSEDTFQNEVREILKDYSKTYQAAGEKVIAAVLEKVHDGEPVSQAVKEALAETDFQTSIEKAVTDAVLLAACAGYGVKPELLTDVSRETLTRHLLDDAWAEDNVKLSRRLHTLDVEKRVIKNIQTALRNAQTIRDTAMELYDGYNTGEGELDRSHLTKQLGKITSLASLALSGDEEAAREVRKAARKVKQYALNLQTPNLRTAYAELADVCGDNLTEKALDRAIRAAIEERTRYHAERIARTEAARAWYDGHIARTQDDEDVWGYRWVLSSRHALVPFDQCDVCANANVGYGKGIYPKNRVPSIPRHPHCMCSLVDVIVGETKGQSRKMNEDGARSYIDGLSDRQKMQLFGIEGWKAYEDGGDWQSLLRGWDGFSEPKSRLNPKWFTLEENDSSELGTVEQAKKRDHKILITDAAIQKVRTVDLPELSLAEAESLALENKKLLRVAMEQNDSNEVISVMSLKQERTVRQLGTEGKASPGENPEAVALYRSAERKELAYLHNHPSTNGLSLQDIMTFVDYGPIGIMSVVTNQGSTFLLQKTSKYDYNRTKEIFAESYQMWRNGDISYDEAVKRFLKRCSKGGVFYGRSSKNSANARNK